jgi:hypothetical protein
MERPRGSQDDGRLILAQYAMIAVEVLVDAVPYLIGAIAVLAVAAIGVAIAGMRSSGNDAPPPPPPPPPPAA